MAPCSRENSSRCARSATTISPRCTTRTRTSRTGATSTRPGWIAARRTASPTRRPGFWEENEGTLVIPEQGRRDPRARRVLPSRSRTSTTSRLRLHPVLARRDGTGATTEAVNLLVGYLFERTKVNRLRSSIHPGNAASKRIAEKTGFAEHRGRILGHALDVRVGRAQHEPVVMVDPWSSASATSARFWAANSTVARTSLREAERHVRWCRESGTLRLNSPPVIWFASPGSAMAGVVSKGSS